MWLYVLLGLVVSVTLGAQGASAQQNYDVMFTDANALFRQGQYAPAIAIYDDILEDNPRNADVLKQKAIAQMNGEMYRESLFTFYTVLQDNPYDPVALAGAGVGFGNLGEYHESRTYFERAISQDPENPVYQNYAIFVESILAKYPYTPTPKPQAMITTTNTVIPAWTVELASLWVQGDISNTDFADALSYLLEERALAVPHVHNAPASSELASQMVQDLHLELESAAPADIDMATTVQVLANTGLVKLPLNDSAHDPEQLKNDLFLFKNYLGKIISNINKETRYIEYPNPSGQVIKKFLRDYIQWNFEEEAKHAATGFADPRISIKGDAATIHYNVFVNRQPSGLPLDHVSTLANALEYWERQTLRYDGMDTKIKFNITNSKEDANVWVTWVVRDLGENVLGHANIGKGIVEVTLGGYSCDGSFQLYDVFSVLEVMTHELGHSIGLAHVDDPDSIMYPSLTPSYAYCLI